MSEEEKKAIKRVIKAIEDDKKSRIVTIYDEKPLFRDVLQTILNLINKQQKEIEELKKVIKMVEIYKSNGIPEDAEMVIMRKDDFLRRSNKEFINTDKIKDKIKEEEKYQETTKKLFPDSLNYHMQKYAIEVLKELLEE